MLLGLVFGYSHMISGAESTMSYGNDYRTAVFLSLSLAQLIVNLLHVYVLYIHSIDTRIQLNYFFFLIFMFDLGHVRVFLLVYHIVVKMNF